MGLTRTNHRSMRRTNDVDDEGSILILTLLLTIVLAAVVLALATYAATGLRTSKVTTERTESNTVAAAGVTWAIEEFAKKQLDPAADCDSTIGVPSGLLEPGESVLITCTTQPQIDRHPTVRLEAVGTTAAGTDRTIDVVLQVPAAQHTTQVHSWVVG